MAVLPHQNEELFQIMAALAAHIMGEGADPISLFDPPQYRQGMDRQVFEQKKRAIRALRVNWAKFFNQKGPKKDLLASKGLIAHILSRLEATLETATNNSRKGQVLVFQLRSLAKEIEENGGGSAPKRRGSAQFLTIPQERILLERILGANPGASSGLNQDNFWQVVEGVDRLKRSSRNTAWNLLDKYALDITKTPGEALDLRAFSVCRGLGAAASQGSERDITALLVTANQIFAEGNDAHKLLVLMGKAHCVQHGYTRLVGPADKIMEGLAFYTKPAMKFMSRKLISGIIHAIYYMIGKSGLEAGIEAHLVPDNLHGTGLSNRSLYEIAADGVDDAINQSNFYGIVWMSIQIAMSLVSDKSNNHLEAAELIGKASQFQPKIPSGRTREEYGAIVRAVDYVYQFSSQSNGDHYVSRRIVRDLLKYDLDNIVEWFELSIRKGGN